MRDITVVILYNPSQMAVMNTNNNTKHEHEHWTNILYDCFLHT